MKQIKFLPRNIGIELVRGCNFACRTCPVTAKASAESEKLQFISLDLLEQLVTEIDRWPMVEQIWFFHFGEPMLHPKYRECLEILHRSPVARKAVVIQYTNASLLNGDKAEAILDIPVVKKLAFSFDGFGDKSSFERMRGPHFDRVFANIREFAPRARQRRPDLMLATCTILPREGEVPDLAVPDREDAVRKLGELFEPLGVAVEARDMHNYSGNDDLLTAAHDSEEVAGGCPFVEQNSLYLTVHGKAQPCCAVYDESFNVGCFPDQDLAECLNSDRMRYLRHELRLDRRRDLPFCRNCSLSLAALGKEGLRAKWLAVDRRGELDDLTERRHLLGNVLPTRHPVLRLDLGCGPSKHVGFIGADRFPLPGVNVVLDLDQPLPFADDSVDMVLASHSLEHVRDLLATTREIYRVCKHGAQVYIVAPHFHQGLNLGNPYHIQCFNEHTPRFWTNCPTTLVDPAEYVHPQGATWGLADTDHSKPDIDLRCLRMEFFYFPEYRRLAPDQQRAARHKHLDVCDQIVYHLLVVKGPVTDEEVQELTKHMEYYEPAWITSRKATERLEAEVDEMKALLEAADTKLAAAQAEIDQMRSARQRGIAHELDSLRHRRVTRLLQRFRGKSDLSNDVAAPFQQLKDDSLLFSSSQRGYRLQPSLGLRRVPFLQYPLGLDRPNLTGVSLAPIVELTPTSGVIGIEIVAPDNSIVAQQAVPASQIDRGAPTRIEFPPIGNSNQGQFKLRVFVRDVDVPVRLLEWRKYSCLGFGRLQTRAFCGFHFDDSI